MWVWRNVATNLLFSEGPTPEAMDLAKRAIEFGPNEADGYNAMGLALTRLGRPAEAEKCYEASLRLDPDQPEIRVNLGNVLRFKSPERAIECYREALRLKPDDAKRTTTWETCSRLVRRGSLRALPSGAADCSRIRRGAQQLRRLAGAAREPCGGDRALRAGDPFAPRFCRRARQPSQRDGRGKGQTTLP